MADCRDLVSINTSMKIFSEMKKKVWKKNVHRCYGISNIITKKNLFQIVLTKNVNINFNILWLTVVGRSRVSNKLK